MTPSEALAKLLRSYEPYYDVVREDVTAPFAAEAAFHSHDEQYFLVKSAKLSEAESHEYVFFAAEDKLTLTDAQALDEAAWSTGISRVMPHSSHRNTDIVLIILAGSIEPGAASFIKKLRRYQSYKFGFQGWSHYRVIALETSSGQLIYNRLGQHLKKLLRNIYSKK